MPDWVDWLEKYDEPLSPLAQRLAVVKRRISVEMNETSPKPCSVISICAGDGRDILDVLVNRGDAWRFQITLVELDAHLCLLARAKQRRHALSRVEVRRADAGVTDTYIGMPKANLLILVGVFGNIAFNDMLETISILPALCQPEALVIWGRLNEEKPVASARDAFAAASFTEITTSRYNAVYYVGTHRFTGETLSLPPQKRFFSFNNDGKGGRPF